MQEDDNDANGVDNDHGNDFQRRAILHLKSQKRKIKDKNKTQVINYDKIIWNMVGDINRAKEK